MSALWSSPFDPHCQRWIENLSDLLSLQYKENKGKFAACNGPLKAKSFSASGGFAPLNPRPGALPLDPAGGSASDPRYRLALHARHERPLFDPHFSLPSAASGWMPRARPQCADTSRHRDTAYRGKTGELMKKQGRVEEGVRAGSNTSASSSLLLFFC